MKIEFKTICISFLGAVFLLGFAIYNGYPIVYSDTSTYIASGFSLEPPADRPLTYGLFIRLISLNGISLWSVAFIQCLIISYLILLTIRDFTQHSKPNSYFFIVIAFLSAFTVLPFVSGQIITDIFSSIALLCILHLSLNSKLKKPDTILLFIIFFLANAMHLSHLLINLLLLFSILFIKRFFFRQTIDLKYKNILILFILTLLGIIPMGSSLAKSSSVFFMGRMAGNGILTQFLQENCKDNKYKLCDCIDSIPTNSTDFLWDPNSPLYTKFDKWSDTRDEFGEIIKLTLINPKYLSRHIYESAKNTIQQLTSFNAGDGTGPFVGETLLFNRIKKYFVYESNKFSLSKQNKGLLSADKLIFISKIYFIIIILSTLGMLFTLFYKKIKIQIAINKLFFIYIVLIAILINSFVNSSLVLVTDRFGAKLIWMIPFILFIVVSNINFRKLFSN